MKFMRSTPAGISPVEQFAAESRLRTYLASVFTLLALWMLPDVALAQEATLFNFPVLDQLFCGFITYSKTKLAPYIAVLTIIIGVIGHWLGATKVWGMLLYVVLGLGIIMGIGAVVANVTNAGATCL